MQDALGTLRYWLSLAQMAGVLMRLLATPRNRPLALGFFVNKVEMGIHPTLCPGASFIRINSIRPRQGWNAARFARFLNRLTALTVGRPVEAIVWGYRDRRNHGVDVGTYFDDCWRVERALIEPPKAAGNAFVVGYRSIYFDGRESTDLERRLNALIPGTLPQSPDGRRLLEHILSRSLSKFQGTSDLAVRPTERDLVIIGQCTGDQAVEDTDALARDNPGLIDLVAKHLLSGGHGFERVCFKPHP